jgi:hypothetical protein
MDCEQIRDLLDAHALGAADATEAAAIEAHVADCVRCWSSLEEAQRAAVSLALSTVLQKAPPSLRSRVLAEAERRRQPALPSFPGRLRWLWPAAAGTLAVGAVAALAFALVLQSEVSGLRDDKDRLAADVEDAGAVLEEQRQLMSVLAAPDAQQISLDPADPDSEALAVYYWSRTSRTGALLSNNLPALGEGQVYRVWVLTGDEVYDVGSFESWNGVGQLSMDMKGVSGPPVGIGVSIEDAAGAQQPREMLLFAEFPR